MVYRRELAPRLRESEKLATYCVPVSGRDLRDGGRGSGQADLGCGVSQRSPGSGGPHALAGDHESRISGRQIVEAALDYRFSDVERIPAKAFVVLEAAL